MVGSFVVLCRVGVSGCELGFTLIDVSSGSLGRIHEEVRRERRVEESQQREEREVKESWREETRRHCVCVT